MVPRSRQRRPSRLQRPAARPGPGADRDWRARRTPRAWFRPARSQCHCRCCRAGTRPPPTAGPQCSPQSSQSRCTRTLRCRRCWRCCPGFARAHSTCSRYRRGCTWHRRRFQPPGSCGRTAWCSGRRGCTRGSSTGRSRRRHPQRQATTHQRTAACPRWWWSPSRPTSGHTSRTQIHRGAKCSWCTTCHKPCQTDRPHPTRARGSCIRPGSSTGAESGGSRPASEK
mmetsp:Transcript_36519/g.95591  ORF Transcript_36519/g.95591 Transcript_36519/m.95591 type:complete len:226 (+) Transcript_36519:711-1388(+)